MALVIGLLAANAAHAECEVAKLLAQDGAPTDSFGLVVSASGDAVVIGAPFDDDHGDRSGAAYVYRKLGLSWIEEAKLRASDADAADQFGAAVSMSGDLIVVGAWHEDEGGVDAGAAYVFRFDGEVWVEEAKLTASDRNAGDAFGRSVGVDVDRIVVGAYFDDDGGLSAGSAYVFRYVGGEWIEEAKLTADDGTTADQFGIASAISGNAVLVGAPLDDDDGDRSGSAYVFRFAGGEWLQEAKLRASDAAEGDRFGSAVALDGRVALIGAPNSGNSGNNQTDGAGAAYVFRFEGGAWTDDGKLIAFDAAASDGFGQSVATDGIAIVVGAWHDDDGAPNAGSAHLYGFDGEAWVWEDKLLASDRGSADEFGVAVGISDGRAAVGAPQFDHNGNGAAYVYDLGGGDCDGDGSCDDGVFCNGAEFCVPGCGCHPGDPPDCHDDVACTLDACDEALDQCLSVPDATLCDNGLFCDGAEVCDPVDGCLGGAAPCADDAMDCCDEVGNVCEPCIGACCFGAGGCLTDVEPTPCASAGGLYAGNGSSCDDAVCEPGACCLGDAGCIESPESECADQGGDFQGRGTSCASACLVRFGACCIENICIPQQAESDCVAVGGAWGGLTCDGADQCNPGACCTDEGCTLQVETECEDVGGVFLGSGTSCQDESCSAAGRIVSSSPPDGAIDARQPFDLKGGHPAGWRAITLTFSSDAAEWSIDSFAVEVDPPGAAPNVVEATPNGLDLTLVFDQPIPPGAWTIITHLESGTSVRLGYLPGDVSGDGATTPSDVIELIDSLNGTMPRENWQTDINRSDLFEPSDVLTLIDLVNGAGVHDIWNGRTLPQ